MWLVKCYSISQETDYHGPFPTVDRANRYASVCKSIDDMLEVEVLPLNIPFSVVQKILWRSE